MRFLILWLRVWSLSYETNEKLKAFIYNGSEQFGHYWVLPCNYKYLVTDLNMSMADQDDICKLGRVCCALPLDPWSQYRSEKKEDFIGRCCQPSKYFTLRFFSLPRFLSKTKTKMSKIIMRVNIYHHLLTKLQKSSYATALVENFVATFPETIFSHAANFCSLYCTFSASQSLANFIYIYSNQIYLPIFYVLQFL